MKGKKEKGGKKWLKEKEKQEKNWGPGENEDKGEKI